MNSKAQVALHVCVRLTSTKHANKVDVGKLGHVEQIHVCRIRSSKTL